MLGSVADAEDVVQEARLRLLKQDSAPDNEEAWLFRVVTNLALDRLRREKRQRERYPGPWLPEPLPTESTASSASAIVEDSTPEGVVELAESLSMGLLLMLERLTPAERVVFVLREGFDLGFDDIADLVSSSAANCRQRYRRAKNHLAGEPGPRAVSVEDSQGQRQVLEKLLAALASHDLEQMVALFAEDCVAYADGGGVVSAAIRPVTDPARIAQVSLHLVDRIAAEGSVDFRWCSLNGGTGLLVTLDGVLHSSIQVDVADGQVQRLYIVRNPEKLAHLSDLLK
jgi:RNA polymerase sigma-70 factor (ECF subfamily)